jgi:uncharacterized protein (DUF1786 family)
MKILTVDIGTGTQDIFLFNSRLDIENGYKLILPSPTMIVHRKLNQAAQAKQGVILYGVIMGGGPSAWAVENLIKLGLKVYATPDAARSFNDDLDAVQASGVVLISEDEISSLPTELLRVELKDFDYEAIYSAFSAFGVSLSDLSALAVAVFDHGNAPKEISDRQFRFDYLDQRIRAQNRLSAFAYLKNDIPPSMTRLQAVARSASKLELPLIVMDTAPAAILGALYDPFVSHNPTNLVVNIGNFHTLAFRLGPQNIEGVFEHHTGLLTLSSLEKLLASFAEGSLTHADVFEHQGHGALLYTKQPMLFGKGPYDLVATGPRRAMLRGSKLHVYNAVPFGDMMIAGCFGMLAAAMELLPDKHDEIAAALSAKGSQTAPWDA